jgi:hypothetical protein
MMSMEGISIASPVEPHGNSCGGQVGLQGTNVLLSIVKDGRGQRGVGASARENRDEVFGIARAS